MLRLGGPIDFDGDPGRWAQAVRRAGYRAAFCPLKPGADDAAVRALADAADACDIVIAEVGAWSNPLSGDATVRAEALKKCIGGLDLAERVGARCCVNIAGSRGAKWDGPCPLDLTDETFEMIVESVRGIIDAVKPARTFYTLEPMPWMVPDSADSYLRLIEAVDREAFAVHFDPVNLVNSPARFFDNAALIRECVAKLGPKIKSVHVKDIALGDRLTVHLDEVVAGRGGLDLAVLLTELDRLAGELPIMLEHLPSQAEYAEAAAHVRRAAEAAGVRL